jgi:hypothetical protein
MKSIKALVFLLLLSLSQIGFAEKDKFDFVRDHPIKYEYPSKFGMIQFTNEGSVVLNGKILLQGNSEKDYYDVPISYAVADVQGNLTSPAVPVQSHGQKSVHVPVYRLILVGLAQNPVFYRVLDLTGEKPYISEPFGTTEYHGANEYKTTKWGKNKSLIKLVGNMEYIYTTGKVVEEN